jgi:hypothetical protein
MRAGLLVIRIVMVVFGVALFFDGLNVYLAGQTPVGQLESSLEGTDFAREGRPASLSETLP